MRALVLNTGTELLLGQVLNTHLNFIAREIFPLGLRIERQLTVPDGPAILETLREASDVAEIIFVTGGLGPTTDDITREAAAEMAGVALREDAELAAAITERLRVRGFPMTDRILRQAQVPEGAIVLPNNNGTAPGLYLCARARESGGQTPHLFLLPGPPRELQPMFRESVMPILRDLAPTAGERLCRTFRLACIGESVVEKEAGERLLAIPDLELGYCARAGAVDVRLIGPSTALEKGEAILTEAFPVQLFTKDDEEFEEVIVRLLRERGATVATAESCTGGHLANRLTNVSGSSAVFLGGFVAYANEVKRDSLGVPEAVLAEHGPVSAEVARAMAEGALRLTGAVHALATTGIAGPAGGSEEKPVGTAYIAWASSSGETEVRRRRFLAERPVFKQLVSQTAFQLLRERLLGLKA